MITRATTGVRGALTLVLAAVVVAFLAWLSLFGAPSVDKSGAPRLALHAAELGFEHPFTGEELRFSMPLPADLQKFLARLRKESQA